MPRLRQVAMIWSLWGMAIKQPSVIISKEEEEKHRKKIVDINDSEELTEYNIFVRQHRMAARSDFVSDGTKKAMRLRPQPPQPL